MNLLSKFILVVGHPAKQCRESVKCCMDRTIGGESLEKYVRKSQRLMPWCSASLRGFLMVAAYE
jgi:hypothetical protein